MRRNSTSINTTNPSYTLDVDHGSSILIRTNENRRDVSCVGQTIYLYQSNFLEELSDIKEGVKYCLDSMIDLQGFEISVPTFGIDIHGINDVAGFTDSTDDHTMFVCQEEGAGDIILKRLTLQQSGANSCLFYIWANGIHKDFTFQNNNAENTLSMGTILEYDELITTKNLPDNRLRFEYLEEGELRTRYTD